MTVDLHKLLGLDDEPKQSALAQLIAGVKTRNPMDRIHFISHLEGKLDDPQHKACSEDLEKLCESVTSNFTPDYVRMLIDEIMPDEQEMAMWQFMVALQTLLGPTTKGSTGGPH